jgi:signal peptidase I
LQVGDLLNIGKLNLGPVVPLTVVANAITVSGSYHFITSATTVNLTKVNGGVEGDIVVLRGAVGSVVITATDNTANLRLAGNFLINNPTDTMVLLFDGTNWLELARSNNG